MGTQYEKFKQKANAKAKQNRVNRVTKKANKYNDGKLNKTHKTYIAGDVKSSASTRAFGYKKYGMTGDSYITEKGRSRTNQAKIDRGENPYELKYIYDGVSRKVNGGTRADGSKYDSFTSKKRFLTDDEKKAWKATGSTNVKEYDRTHKYSILRGYDSDGKTFKSNLNFRDNKGKIKWDGMEVAKNKVKNGGSKLNYIGGFLKDTVIDPGVDLMKRFDYVESGLMGGAIGLGETINDVGKALTHKSKKLSDVNYKRAIDNFNQSISQSNKEGWGKSAVDYFKDWSNRSDEERYQEILKTKGKKSADEFKKSTEKLKPFTDTASTVLGFGADLLNPFEVGSAVTKTTKKLVGDSIDLAKNIKKGTADISLGFTPDKGKTQEMIDKFAKRYNNLPKPKKSVVEDTLTAGSREINDVDFKANKNGRLLRNSLDKGYSNAIAKENVKEVVKNNPTTPNLSNFLDSLPSKTDEKTLKDTYKGFYKTRGDGKFDKDGLFEMLDNIDDDFSYDMLDWLKTNKPNLYKEYLGDIDNVDFHADNIINKRNFETKEYDLGNKRKNYLDDGVSLHKINDVNKYVDPTNPNLNEAYNKMNMERLGNKVDDVKKVRQRVISLKPKFAQNARNFEGKVADMDVKSLNELSKRFKDMGDMENVDDILDSIDFLNKNIFGEDVIRKNLPKKHFKRLANHLEDMVNYYLGKANGEFSYNVRDAKGNVLKKYFTDKNGVQRPFDELYNLLAPTSVDEMFETKMSDLSRMFGVSHKGEITVPLKKLQNKIDLANMGKTGRNILEPKNILNTEELREYNSLLSRKKEWDRIYKEIADLDFEDYPKFMKENYGLSDGVDEILDSFAEESARKKATLNDFIDEVMEEFNPSGKALDEKELKGIKSEAIIRYQEYLGDFDNYKTRTNINNRNSTYVDRGGKQVLHESPRVEQENLNKVGEVFDLSDKKRFEKDLKEFRNKYKLPQTYNTKAKIKLSKGQKLGQLPPVIENSKNLRKAVEIEMEVMFKNPKEYAKVKDYFTQVKKEYVNALRSYGVKDESYFGKVQQLQKELKQYYSELNKPSNLIKKGSESGSGTPKMGMNLQLLAEKISKTFDEIDEVLKNTDIDPLFEEGDDKVWQTLNNASRNTIENMSKRSKRYVDNATVPEKAMDYDAFVDEDNSVLGDFWKKINANQEDLSYLRPEVQEVIRNGKPIKKNNPKITSKLDDIYYRNAYKLNGGELPKPSAKLFEDGRMLDFSTGEMRPVTKNAKAENHALKEAHKYSKRNYDEDIEIGKFIQNIEKRSIYDYFAMFDRMNIKFDPNDQKSVEKAFSKFDWILNKKQKEGRLDLNKIAKNRAIDTVKRQDLELASKGLDHTVDRTSDGFKQMGEALNKHQYSPQINADVDMANALNDDMKKILEYESNKKPNQTILDKMSNKDKPSILEEIKSNKKSKAEIRKEQRQKKTLNNLRSERSDDVKEIIEKNRVVEGAEKIANRDEVLNQISNGKKPKPKLKDKDKLIKEISTDEKVAQKLNSGELSLDELATAIDEDIAEFEKANSKKQQFKDWFKDGDNIGYDNGNELYNGYKRWLNTWKKGLTAYNFGWHFQNFFQNKGQNYLALGADAFGSQKEARQHLKNIQGLDNKAGNIINKKTGEVFTPQNIKDLALQYGVVDGFGDDIKNARGIFPNLETKIDNSWIMKKLGNSEQTARLYHFITKLERGATPEQASKSVNKYLFDYSKRNKFDRAMSDFVDPFWTFHKNNAKMLTQAMYENPSGSANILRANRGLDSSLRGEDESNSKYREHQAPFASFKDSVNGDTYDYQYDETVLPDVEDAIPLEKDDILNKLNPLLNIAYKQSQGVGNFDKKVVDDEAGWNEITKDERMAEIAKDLNPFMNPLVKTYYKTKDRQEKADKGKQSQETSDKQILMDWIAYITGNKGNYYRDWK